MNKIYTRIDWKNYPQLETPLNETNLNRMDYAIDEQDNRIITLDTSKVNVTDIQNLIKSWSINEQTGVINIEKVNGEKIVFDLNIEKIPISFSLSSDGILTMTTDDGTVWTANIGSMIPILTFNDSDTIAVSVSQDGINKTYSFSVKGNSITEDMLEVGYLANIKLESAKAKASADNALLSENNAKESEDNAKISENNAKDSENNASDSVNMAKSYAIGTNGEVREGDSTDNSKYYSEKSEEYKNDSLEYRNLSESYAIGTNDVVRDGDSTDNSKYYYEQGKESYIKAKTSEVNAKTSELISKENKENSEKYSNLSKSYAVGTGNTVRDGDSTDNAKTYCETAQTESIKCKQYAETSENALEEIIKKMKATKFTIDFTTGNLIEDSGESSFIFIINNTSGQLQWEVVE